MLPTSLYETTQINDEYILSENCVEMRKGGRLNQSIILTYSDGTEWVYLNNKPQERFCGFLYLQHVLKESKLEHILPAENKMAIHQHKIIYLSKYCGEKRPSYFEQIDRLQALKENAGFTDIADCTNLREQDGTIYIFDTEKGSFDSRVHEKIDAFVKLHDVIKASLEKKVKDRIGSL